MKRLLVFVGFLAAAQDLDYFPWPPHYTLVTNSTTNISLSASGHYLALVMQLPESGTITGGVIRVGAVTSPPISVTVGYETVGTDGYPTGTNYGGSSPATISITAAGIVYFTLANSAGANAGDVVALTVRWSSGGTVAFTPYTNPQAEFPYIAYNTGTATRNANRVEFYPRYSTGWKLVPGLVAIGTSATPNVATNGDLGNVFTVTRPVRMIGWHVQCFPSTSAAWGLRLYRDTQLVAEITFSGRIVSAGGAATPAGHFLLASPVWLQPGVVYRVTLRLGASGTLQTRTITAADDDQRAILGLYTKGRMWRTDFSAGSWTEDTSQLVHVFPLLSDVGVTGVPFASF